MNKTYDVCYKKDSKGKTRIWYMEQEGSKFRTIAGLKDGKLVTSEWTQAETTNEGRSNERDPVAQATFEIKATYKKKLDKDYHTSEDTISDGSHIFEPMLAEKWKPFLKRQKGNTEIGGFGQPKLDGIRCIIDIDGLKTRNGKPITSCPHIYEALKPLLEQGMKFDGELYNHELKDEFEELVSLIRKQKSKPEHYAATKDVVQLHIYDFPSKGEENFSVRFSELSIKLFHTLMKTNAIQLVETIAVSSIDDHTKLHEQWLAQGYEGSMWRANTPYECDRTWNLIKRKEFDDDEFEVVRIEEGKGNWAGAAKKVICRTKDGIEFGAGIRGKRPRLREILHEDHKVVTVRYFGLTADGKPRFGVVTKFHGARREL